MGTYKAEFASTNANVLINSRYAISDAAGAKSVDPAVKSGNITVSQGQDTDNDGMEDSWETKYFGNLNRIGTADYDNDGFTDRQEYENGTDPTVKSGDMNGDGNLNLNDAILGLKVICGMNPAGIKLGADVNKDGKIGLQDIVFVLQKVSGIR